mmetsp:Transcript_64477/g.151890  ORF Transcript_64477/g.151890 Transcript_64477/m.151890 type:complete len:372 (+) Transcript_64477:1001-2116(+)
MRRREHVAARLHEDRRDHRDDCLREHKEVDLLQRDLLPVALRRPAHWRRLCNVDSLPCWALVVVDGEQLSERESDAGEADRRDGGGLVLHGCNVGAAEGGHESARCLAIPEERGVGLVPAHAEQMPAVRLLLALRVELHREGVFWPEEEPTQAPSVHVGGDSEAIHKALRAEAVGDDGGRAHDPERDGEFCERCVEILRLVLVEGARIIDDVYQPRGQGAEDGGGGELSVAAQGRREALDRGVDGDGVWRVAGADEPGVQAPAGDHAGVQDRCCHARVFARVRLAWRKLSGLARVEGASVSVDVSPVHVVSHIDERSAAGEGARRAHTAVPCLPLAAQRCGGPQLPWPEPDGGVVGVGEPPPQHPPGERAA